MEQNDKSTPNIQTGIASVQMPVTDYQPLVDSGSWRVAVLKSCVNTNKEMIKTMQKHMETDEVFVLLSGKCTLLSAGNGNQPTEIQKVELEADQVYTVQKGFWHNHVLSQDGAVLIVENRDTTDDNSPIHALTDEQIQQILTIA